LPGSYVYRNRNKFRLNINDEESEYSSIDWGKYHIHHNHYHWWGMVDDFEIMNTAYQKLDTFVKENWLSRHTLGY
jgi:hypothetical protein